MKRFKKLKCGAQVKFVNGIFYLKPEYPQDVGIGADGVFHIDITEEGLLEVLQLAEGWS